MHILLVSDWYLSSTSGIRNTKLVVKIYNYLYMSYIIHQLPQERLGIS